MTDYESFNGTRELNLWTNAYLHRLRTIRETTKLSRLYKWWKIWLKWNLLLAKLDNWDNLLSTRYEPGFEDGQRRWSPGMHSLRVSQS